MPAKKTKQTEAAAERNEVAKQAETQQTVGEFLDAKPDTRWTLVAPMGTLKQLADRVIPAARLRTALNHYARSTPWAVRPVSFDEKTGQLGYVRHTGEVHTIAALTTDELTPRKSTGPREGTAKAPAKALSNGKAKKTPPCEVCGSEDTSSVARDRYKCRACKTTFSPGMGEAVAKAHAAAEAERAEEAKAETEPEAKPKRVRAPRKAAKKVEDATEAQAVAEAEDVIKEVEAEAEPVIA